MGRLCRGRAAEQNEGRGEIKHFSCFHWPVLLYGPYFKGAPICPRHPEAPGGKSSNGWRLASSTGNLTPRVVLTQPPPLPATDHGGGPLQRSDVRLDGSIIVPAAGHGRTGSHPVLAACCFSLLARETNQRPVISFSVVSRCFLPADHRAAAAWALAFAKAAGMCLMNGYAVFKVPGEAKKDLSLYLPLSERSNNPIYSKKFFSFLSILFFRLWMACWETPRDFATSLSVFSSKNRA